MDEIKISEIQQFTSQTSFSLRGEKVEQYFINLILL